MQHTITVKVLQYDMQALSSPSHHIMVANKVL